MHRFSLVSICAALITVAACGSPSSNSGGGGPGITCTCTGSGPSPGTENANRVHISNDSNQAGITVVLTAGMQVCTIDQLIVNDPSGDRELDQCVMQAGVGETVTIGATTAAAFGAAATCVVDATATLSGESGPQTFAGVFTEPVLVVCGTGFAF
jgi:hypothetical protein